jgi:hypothetical protein
LDKGQFLDEIVLYFFICKWFLLAMKKQLKERGAIYMSKIIRKRVSALLVSALMVASSVTVTSGSFFVGSSRLSRLPSFHQWQRVR